MTATVGGGSGLNVASFDLIITILYIVGIVGLGLYAGHLMNRRRRVDGESKDYFLTGALAP
jgi:hypothetical protein